MLWVRFSLLTLFMIDHFGLTRVHVDEQGRIVQPLPLYVTFPHQSRLSVRSVIINSLLTV